MRNWEWESTRNRLPSEAVESPLLETFKTHVEVLPFSLALGKCPRSTQGRVNFCSGHEGHSQVILYQLRSGERGVWGFSPRCAGCALRWRRVPVRWAIPCQLFTCLVHCVISAPAVSFISLLFLVNSTYLNSWSLPLCASNSSLHLATVRKEGRKQQMYGLFPWERLIEEHHS